VLGLETMRTHFRALNDKKLCILGLTSILRTPKEQLPGSLHQGFGQLLAGRVAHIYISSSSYKIKKDIEELNDNEFLNKIVLLKPCKYRYIDDNKNLDPVKKVYGFRARQVKQILSEAIDDTTEQIIPNKYNLGNVENDILTIDAE
jgi:hypothetical protein